MSNFDIDLMFERSKAAIEKFSQEHTEEMFYAFSIDANMLCLNSLENFYPTLAYMQEQYPKYSSNEKEVLELKYNTGNWEYQGFFTLRDGFDDEAYDKHYNLPMDNPELFDEGLEEAFSKTSYHLAMQALLDKIVESGILNLLKKTPDFKVFLSEHDY